MGVRGLQYYCEKHCTGAFTSANIIKAAEEYSRKYNKQPILVIDGLGLIRCLYGGRNWYAGGQWKEYVESWKQFVNKLKSAGIKLIFFFDGVVCKSKIDTWVSRRLKSIKDIEIIFEILNHGDFPPDELFQIPPCMGFFTQYVLKFECNCDCVTTLSECDWEVAKYALDNKCFGILGQDSDFIIYDAAEYYFSALHLNINTMDTMVYDRHKLSSALGLSVKDLPLFACLVGNDHFSRDSLFYFHKNLVKYHRPRIEDVIKAVAKFIRSNNPHTDLHKISNIVFGDDEMTTKLLEGINSYNLSHKDSEKAVKMGNSVLDENLTELALNMHVNCDQPPTVFACLCGAPYQSSTVLEDFNSPLPSCAIVFRKIRQRVYFLLHVQEVPEWCTYKSCTLKAPDKVKCLPLEGGLVDLKCLWESYCNNDLKWQVFNDCVGTHIDIKLMKSIPEQYVSLCSVLHYLTHDLDAGCLKPFEIDAIILQAVNLSSMDLDSLSNLIVKKPVDPRAVQLSSIFIRGLSNILLVVGTIRGPIPMAKVLPWNCFDGKLFLAMYESCKRGLKIANILGDEANIELFYQLRNVVECKIG